MNRPRNEQHFRPQHRKYQQLTPKIPAKTPANYRQRKLAGQSSALPANRQKSKHINYVKMQTPSHRLQSLTKQKTPLTQDEIKNSAIYKLLQEEIANLAKRQQSQISKMQQIKKLRQKDLTQIKTQQHSIKLQIWELKNQAMQLKDSIRDQKDQTQRLMYELGIQQGQQGQEGQQQERQSSNLENANTYQHQRTSYSDPQQGGNQGY